MCAHRPLKAAAPPLWISMLVVAACGACAQRRPAGGAFGAVAAPAFESGFDGVRPRVARGSSAGADWLAAPGPVGATLFGVTGVS